MKTTIVFFVLLFCSVSLTFAQTAKQKCTYTKFKNGKIATAQCLEENGNFGTTFAFNLKGDTIGKWNFSRMHQYSSVHFTFHPNGMVHKADFGSHPDGGIQWYRSMTEFNEEGVQVSFWEQSHDDRVTIEEPFIHQPAVVQPKIQDTVKKENEVMKCAVIYVSELWLDNRTKKDIKVSCKHKFSTYDKSDSLITIKAGERVKICERILAEQYEKPMDYFAIELFNAKGKPLKSVRFSDPLINDEQISNFRKGYVYDILSGK